MAADRPGNPRKANGHRRRQVTARVYAEEHDCGICGKPVDKSLTFIDPTTGKPNPWAKSVDEIIPVSLGGSPIDRANCRLAHRDCNIKRGNGTRSRTARGPIDVVRARAY